MGKIKVQNINSDKNSNFSVNDLDPIIEELSSSNESINNDIKKNFKKIKIKNNLKKLNFEEENISPLEKKNTDNNFTINSSEKSDNLDEAKELFMNQLCDLRNIMNEKKLVELKSDSNISFSLNNGLSLNENSRTLFEFGNNSYKTLNLNNKLESNKFENNEKENNKISENEEIYYENDESEENYDLLNNSNQNSNDKINSNDFNNFCENNDNRKNTKFSEEIIKQDFNLKQENDRRNTMNYLKKDTLDLDNKELEYNNEKDSYSKNEITQNSSYYSKNNNLRNSIVSFNNSKKLREEFMKKSNKVNKKKKTNFKKKINPKILYLDIEFNKNGKDKILISNKKQRHKICNK